MFMSKRVKLPKPAEKYGVAACRGLKDSGYDVEIKVAHNNYYLLFKRLDEVDRMFLSLDIREAFRQAINNSK